MGKADTASNGFARTRQDEILLHIKEKGSVTIGTLAQRFDVCRILLYEQA